MDQPKGNPEVADVSQDDVNDAIFGSNNDEFFSDLDQEVNGFPQSRMGNADRWMAPHSVYECANGQKDQWIAIACENGEQWRALSRVIDRDELSSLGLSQRLDREEELDQILRDWCLSRDAAETTELLQAAGVPAHQVQNSPEVTSDPQLIYRNHFVEVPHEIYDTTWAEQYGFRLSRSDGTPTKSGPLWGEHNFRRFQWLWKIMLLS